MKNFYPVEKFWQTLDTLAWSEKSARERFADGYVNGVEHARSSMTGRSRELIDELHEMLTGHNDPEVGSVRASAAKLNDIEFAKAQSLFVEAFQEVLREMGK